jgi:hypothetical protein
MSTLSPIWEDFFTGRKPSRAQVMAKCKAAIQSGAAAISIQWGENAIELDYSFNAREWHGSGWIRDIGGDDIAQDLNRLQRRATIATMNLWNS